VAQTEPITHAPGVAPIEPGHSLAPGMELVAEQVEKDHRGDADDDYGHQFVMKRLKRDMPLPGRWTLVIMLYVASCLWAGCRWTSVADIL
jgi:hypothetical protein